MKKILVYSHDTFGLGNIRRMLAISQHLVKSIPDAYILIASGSPMLHAFRMSPRLDYLKLPCLSRTVGGDYTVKSLGLDIEQTIRLRSNLLGSTFVDYEPDLVLVDKKPFGVGNELGNAINTLKHRINRPKLVLLLRDILDSPEATIPVWQKNGYYEAVEDLYDQVLVVGSEDIYDLRSEYHFPNTSTEKINFCGYIGRDRGRQSSALVRDELGLNGKEKLVLLTVGGGEDGAAILSSYLQAISNDSTNMSFKTLLVCGSELPAQQRNHIVSKAQHLPQVVVKDFTDDLPSYMNAADLVVSMGGYNTVCEILSMKKRSIVIPRVKPVREQLIRAQRMQQLGLLKMLHPTTLTPETLIATVYDELAKSNVCPQSLYQINMSGSDNISHAIEKLLHQHPMTDDINLSKVESL